MPPVFSQAGVPSLVPGLAGVEPINIAQTCPVLALDIVAVQPSPVTVSTGMGFPADTV